MTNPYSAPTTDTDSVLEPAALVHRARVYIVAFGCVSWLFDIGIMVELGRAQLTIFARMAILGSLLYLLYLGKNWARLVLLVLSCLTIVSNGYNLVEWDWSFWNWVGVVWILLHLCAVAMLAGSPELKALIRSRRRVAVHQPTEDEDDDEEDDDEEEDETLAKS